MSKPRVHDLKHAIRSFSDEIDVPFIEVDDEGRAEVGFGHARLAMKAANAELKEGAMTANVRAPRRRGACPLDLET